jgi:hypothetical protein
MIKKYFQNLPYVTNRQETIDFKTFCEGGSPEYVKAKQRLRDFHIKIEPPKREPQSLTAYSLYINPLAFFDPTFFVIGAAVVVVAILEKQLASHGMIFIASAISAILRIAFPVVAAGSFFYLLTHVNFL